MIELDGKVAGFCKIDRKDGQGKVDYLIILFGSRARGKFFMKKYENFCTSLENMKDIYNYEEPYDNVVLTGLVGVYEITFEQSWKMMKEILEIHGFAEGAKKWIQMKSGSARQPRRMQKKF